MKYKYAVNHLNITHRSVYLSITGSPLTSLLEVLSTILHLYPIDYNVVTISVRIYGLSRIKDILPQIKIPT